MTFLYFAYGSNMLPARLLGRCPSAKVVRTGVARAWSLAFSKGSKDGSGKATLVTAPNSAVPGVIFEIDLAEREQLDRHEGVGSGYRRNDTFAIALREQSDSRSSSTFRSIGRALATFTVLGLLDPKTESCYGELTVLLGGRRSYAGQARKQV